MRRSRLFFYSSIFTIALMVALNIPALARIVPNQKSGQPTETITDINQQQIIQKISLKDSPEALEEGKIFYKAGKFIEAVNSWKKAIDTFNSEGKETEKAMALNLVSLGEQQLGNWLQAREAIAQSLQILQSDRALNSSDNNKLYKLTLAQAFNTQGHLQLAQEKAQDALNSWEQAAAIYNQVGDPMGMSGSILNQSLALKSLGLYPRELETLKKLKDTIENIESSGVIGETTNKGSLQPEQRRFYGLKVDALRALGNSFRRVGELEQSEKVLQESLALAKQIQLPQEIAESLLSLGNTNRAQQNTKNALDFYAQASKTAASSNIKIQAQLNQFSLLIDELRLPSAREVWPQITPELSKLPPGKISVYAKINFAENLMRLKSTTSRGVPEWSEVAKILADAVLQAQSLGNGRAEAYALGEMGAMYLANGQLTESLDLTQKALIKSQLLNAPDIAYRWQWQLGRILKAKGENKEAIAVYSEAVKTLQSLRSDLISINTDVQFSFRNSVEPVYRQLMELLLASADTNNKDNQEKINKTLQLMESLQLAELDNFFGDTCSDNLSSSSTVEIDKVDPSAAIIYPIILADRLNIILSIPGQPLHHYFSKVQQGKVEATINQLRQNLIEPRRTNVFSTKTLLPLSQQIYDWLLRPLESELAKNQIKTLVFVQDGVLRNIPMSVLHDRKQYLIEKYAIALSPSRKLIDPKPLDSQKLRSLTAGLTEARQGFSPLPAVAQELKEIQAEVTTVVLLNQDFTTKAIQKELESSTFPVVHLATHGNFSSIAEKTFILTWDGRLNIIQLEKLLKARELTGSNAIELLIFSACQTAQGDNRAALGLAGMAVRSGARSTLATLWAVSDEATSEIMGHFYREIANSKVAKSEALRRAQIDLLKKPNFEHPLFWSPYILVGNWL